jgi:hypothetical protein
MRPLQIILPGKYFDSRIYSGRLYLWRMDGSIQVLNWDRLIDSLAVEPRLRLALECGFKRSDRLYGSNWERSFFFGDPEIKEVLRRRFTDLAQTPIEVTPWELHQAEIRHRGKPMPFPHSDCIIYGGRLHICSPQGVFSTERGRKHPDLTRSQKRWDCPTVGISAGYGNLALSAGSEGLFELAIEAPFGPERPRLLTPLHSSSSHWTFFSIFSSSPLHAGYLLDFDLHKKGRPSTSFEVEAYLDWRSAGMIAEGPPEESSNRSFHALFRAEDLFHRSSFSWGVQEKLCQVSDNEVRIIRYWPWNRHGEERFEAMGEVAFSGSGAEPISADSAVFGYVLEFDDSLLVIESTGEEFRIPGEPVNWRVFPKSRYYENHLHVLFEDRLEIYTFNDDYFVAQKGKPIGIEYRPRPAGRSSAQTPG